MDRGRRTAALAFVLALGSLAASDAPPLAELRWLSPGADPVAALAWQPSECLKTPADTDEAWRVAVGRAAFRSPLTLGGQAARAGVSCETCHRNGRTNPTFLFPGVSGAPGTADVTSSLFSSHRGNGVEDPRPIPDLGGPRSALKISRDPASPALAAFLHGLVVEEFDGPEPTPAVLAGLVAYVRALDPAACDPAASPVRALTYLSDAVAAVTAGDRALRREDQATALAMFAAARARLGRIDERYTGLPHSITPLRKAAAGLAAIEAETRAHDPHVYASLTTWRRAIPPLANALRREEWRSLFDRKQLAARASLPRQGR